MIEPIARVGENIYFPRRNKSYRVVYLEPLPRLVRDFGTIGPGDIVDRAEVTELEMSESELAQVRFRVLDDIEVKVWQPHAVARHLTERVQAKIDLETHQADPEMELAQIYVFEDGVPFFTITNPTGYETPMSRVEFSGWRYQLEKLPAKPEVFAAVPTAGKPVA